MNDDLTPITAVTAADPYTYYDRLIAERPFAYDASVGAWVAASSAAVQSALADPALAVRPPSEPVPKAMAGTPLGEIFGRMVRMNEDPRHAALSGAANGILQSWTPREVASIARTSAQRLASAVASNPGDLAAYPHRVPASAVAALLSIDHPDALALAGDFAGAIAPGATPEDIARGIAAAAELQSALPLVANDDVRANAIAFLFQSYDGTAALIATVLSYVISDVALRDATRRDDEAIDALIAKAIRYDPPVHNTRRFAVADTTILGQTVRSGESVLVLLAAANRDPLAERTYSFGFGTHGCPGSSIAVTIAKAGIAAILESGLDLAAYSVSGYRRSANVRMPLLTSKVPAR